MVLLIPHLTMATFFVFFPGFFPYISSVSWKSNYSGSVLFQTVPRSLDAPILENVIAKLVSCGARHSAIQTGITKIIYKIIYSNLNWGQKSAGVCYES